ncbi:hypothetical protein R1sor_007210 [Riccia sorocarpa]|uniref:F-box domain-containing protein n=1 Tax=Riccia sorocarpa TaxID=122646 RepID=A0ABD3HW33_9MARC
MGEEYESIKRHCAEHSSAPEEEQEKGITPVSEGSEVFMSGHLSRVSENMSSSEAHALSPALLPPEVVAIILSKRSFPDIFQVKVLSRAWYSKLPSLRPVKSLGTLVHDFSSWILPALDVSYRWPTYCPVFVAGQEMVGYDRVQERWRKFPVHHEIPIQEQLREVPYFGLMVNFAGPIMFVYRLGLEEAKVLVTNPVLGRWTKLFGFPTVHESSCVCLVGPEDYRIVVHDPWQHKDGYVKFKTRVLDSKTKTWVRGESVHRSQVNDGIADYGKNVLYSAYMDGNVYCTLTSWWSKKLELWKYTVDSGLWTNIPLDNRFEEFEFQTCGLYAVASQILLVTMVDKTYTNRHSPYYSEYASVYRLDMKTLKFSEPWKSPAMLTRGGFRSWTEPKGCAIAGRIDTSLLKEFSPGSKLHHSNVSDLFAHCEIEGHPVHMTHSMKITGIVLAGFVSVIKKRLNEIPSIGKKLVLQEIRLTAELILKLELKIEAREKHERNWMEEIRKLEEIEKGAKATASPPIDIAGTTPNATRDKVEALLDAGYAVTTEGAPSKVAENVDKVKFSEYIDLFAVDAVE